ncbi:MAG TPA: P-loop NTPase fold protein [bacterium]|nr:P-loop NTPase fold protein [bacterium]
MEQQLPPKPTQEELEEQIDLFSERLADLDEDAFGYKDKAKKVAESLIQNKPPFVYAICGEWGSGKSTFLRYLLEYLPKPDENGIVIYFNAWRESLHKDVMATFVVRLTEQLKHSKVIQEKFTNKKEILTCLEILCDSAAEVAANVAGIGVFLFNVYKRSKDEKKKQITSMIKAEEKLRENFETIATKLNKKKIQPIVIIDELDRCTPSIAVRMIESLRMFFIGGDELQSLCSKHNGFDRHLNDIPFKYILAFDNDFIAKAFKNEYNFESSFEGERYLDKFINFKLEFSDKEWVSYIREIIIHFTPSTNWITTSKPDIKENMLGDITAEHFSKMLEVGKINSTRSVRKILTKVLNIQRNFFSPQLFTQSQDGIEEKYEKIYFEMIIVIINNFLLCREILKSKSQILNDEHFYFSFGYKDAVQTIFSQQKIEKIESFFIMGHRDKLSEALQKVIIQSLEQSRSFCYQGKFWPSQQSEERSKIIDNTVKIIDYFLSTT